MMQIKLVTFVRVDIFICFLLPFQLFIYSNEGDSLIA